MDKLSPEKRSENMRRIRSRDTQPEKVVRSMIHRMGFRFRLHRKDLPGKPDLVFAAKCKVIFVHGCFWHQHGACREGRLPGTRPEYWIPKLTKNRERDVHNQEELRRQGWSALTIWECELSSPEILQSRLYAFLSNL